ncbi:MAG: hypothetical protein M3O70_10510 [Actinomycetota bacterium]|nr:hypothetical protein [Actinomycetota bacterium]
MAGHTEGPTSIGDIRTTVMWPNGLHISLEMLDLIYAGFGERKGWPKTVPPVDADAPFPVPPLEDIGVTKVGGGDPARFVLSSSGAFWRRQKIDCESLFHRFREWEPEAGDGGERVTRRLIGPLSVPSMRLVRSCCRHRPGRSYNQMLWMHGV